MDGATAGGRPSKLGLFLALSRTQHGVLDLATPAVAALLAHGGLPPATTVLLGLATAFAGYTSVYALNDVVDQRADRERLDLSSGPAAGEYLDAALVRHPIAQGLLTPREGLAWALGWALAALCGAWLLNPVCAGIFLGAAGLEVLYCRLWRVSPWRVVVSGLVKTAGGVAAAYAVTPSPEPGFLGLLVASLFAWEVGGQNVPADWTDQDEDRRLGAQTVPVRWGPARAATLALVANALAVGLFALAAARSPAALSGGWLLAATAAGLALLVWPGVRLCRSRAKEDAMALFNRASLWPAALLLVLAARLAAALR